MTELHIKQPIVYGHPEDPAFETTDEAKAMAYAEIFKFQVWVRNRLDSSGRFRSDSRLDSRVKQDMELLTDFLMHNMCPLESDGGESLRILPSTDSGSDEEER